MAIYLKDKNEFMRVVFNRGWKKEDLIYKKAIKISFASLDKKLNKKESFLELEAQNLCSRLNISFDDYFQKVGDESESH